MFEALGIFTPKGSLCRPQIKLCGRTNGVGINNHDIPVHIRRAGDGARHTECLHPSRLFRIELATSNALVIFQAIEEILGIIGTLVIAAFFNIGSVALNCSGALVCARGLRGCEFFARRTFDSAWVHVH